MNWQQLYIAATPAEREEIALLLLQHLAARQDKFILARGRLRRERRRAARLHFIKDRRIALNRMVRTRSIIFKSCFIFILGTLSLATWLIAVNAHPKYGAVFMLYYLVSLIGIFVVRPLIKRRLLSHPGKP